MEKQVRARHITRRRVVEAVAFTATVSPVAAMAQQPPAPAVPASTVTMPPRDFGPNAPRTPYRDPDVITVDPAFNSLVLFNGTIQRLWTGGLYGEGPAWSGQGRYLVWSDPPANRQYRWLDDDGHVSVFRQPSSHSNGNTFDFQGRQVSCENLTRRVVRYEFDGSATVLADSFEGKRLNSPNDVVAHPDGSYWFTDPPYGRSLYSGAPDEPGGPANQTGNFKPTLGQAPGFLSGRRELPTSTYRIDPTGRIDLVLTEEQVPDPNGLCFSPDYKKLYVISTGRGPGDSGPGGKRNMHVFDVAGNKLENGQVFCDFKVDDILCSPDGVRADVNGNLWCSSHTGIPLGYSGVTVWSPDGKLLGRIRLPESCANVCFGGPKRNRLFMTAGESLYALYVGIQGAGSG